MAVSWPGLYAATLRGLVVFAVDLWLVRHQHNHHPQVQHCLETKVARQEKSKRKTTYRTTTENSQIDRHIHKNHSCLSLTKNRCDHSPNLDASRAGHSSIWVGSPAFAGLAIVMVLLVLILKVICSVVDHQLHC